MSSQIDDDTTSGAATTTGLGCCAAPGDAGSGAGSRAARRIFSAANSSDERRYSLCSIYIPPTFLLARNFAMKPATVQYCTVTVLYWSGFIAKFRDETTAMRLLCVLSSMCVGRAGSEPGGPV